MPKPKFSIRVPTFVPESEEQAPDLFSYVKKAEALGFDGIFVVDHLLKPESGYYRNWIEPLTFLSSIAGITGRMKLGTLTLVLTLRQPVLTAKSLATLDVLSRGRVVIGASSGWSEPAFKALGVPYERRGARMDESLELMKRLWVEDQVSYDGQFYSVDKVNLEPKPYQKPYPPIWLGGGRQPYEDLFNKRQPNVTPALKRVARLADGWVPHGSSSIDMIEEDWTLIKREALKAGRHPDQIVLVDAPLTYVYNGTNEDDAKKIFSKFSALSFNKAKEYFLVGSPEDIADRLNERITRLPDITHIIPTPVTFAEEQLDLLAEEVIPKVG